MIEINNIKNKNEFFFFTNTKICKDYTINILKYWESQSCPPTLYVIDYANNTINKFGNNNSNNNLNSNNSNIINKNVYDITKECKITSYPSFCISRNNEYIENIYGGYNNIMNIISFYF